MVHTSSATALGPGVVITSFLLAFAYRAAAVDADHFSESGNAIFSGQHAVAAHLRGDNRVLPGAATRCVNCHDDADSATSFAPPLTRQYLLSDKTRRGGPPSHYDLVSFCHVLHVGIDPMGILLKKAMPQYTLTDTECAALWNFLIQP